MAISSYQVEWILSRFRSWKKRTGRPRDENERSGDRVEFSEAGNELASEQQRIKNESLEPPFDAWPGDLADLTNWPPAVNFELERRAGSFMNPKYPYDPPPFTIPKIKR